MRALLVLCAIASASAQTPCTPMEVFSQNLRMNGNTNTFRAISCNNPGGQVRFQIQNWVPRNMLISITSGNGNNQCGANQPAPPAARVRTLTPNTGNGAFTSVTGNCPAGANPCCVVIQCNAGQGFCDLSYNLVWYSQLSPSVQTGMSWSLAPVSPALTSGTARTYLASINVPLVNTVRVLNPQLAELTVYAVSGGTCGLLPWSQGFFPDPNNVVTSSANQINFQANCVGQGQCCTVIECVSSAVNLGFGCPGVLYDGNFAIASPTPSPTPPPLALPQQLVACGALTLPTMTVGGAPLTLLCSTPSPLAAHDFSLTNPATHQLDLYFTDGVSCTLNPNAAGFVHYTDFSTVTTSPSLLLTGVPCNAEPCCTIVVCSANLGQGDCSGLSTVSTFLGPTASPTVTPTVSSTPTQSPSQGATPSVTPSSSATPTPTLSADTTPFPTLPPVGGGSNAQPAAAPGLPAGATYGIAAAGGVALLAAIGLGTWLYLVRRAAALADAALAGPKLATTNPVVAVEIAQWGAPRSGMPPPPPSSAPPST